MTKDEALKMAIEGLLELHSFVNEELETAYRCNTNQAVKLNAKLDGVEKAIQACKEALEQPAQEPVLYIDGGGLDGHATWAQATRCQDTDIALYTTPPSREWQSLSDEEIKQVIIDEQIPVRTGKTANRYGRAIEAKLKDKNT